MRSSDHEIDDKASALAAALLARLAQPAPEAAPATARRPPAEPLPDAVSIDYPRTLQFVRWYEGLLQAHGAAARALADQNLAPGAAPDPSEDGALMQTLADVHRLLLEHPLACKAAYGALAAEGRRFAGTPEGEALRERLRRSRTIQRAALLWRSLTMGMLSDDDSAALPSTWLDNLLRAARRGDLEQLLGRLGLTRAE